MPLSDDDFFPKGTPFHGYPNTVQGLGDIPSLRNALDPSRVPFKLPDLGKTLIATTDYPKWDIKAGSPWPIRSRTGWESGQAGGMFTDKDNALLHAMTFVAQAGGRSIMACDAHLWSPSMRGDPTKIEFLDLNTLRQFEAETGVKVGMGSVHCTLWCLGVLELEGGLYLCEQFIPAPVLQLGAKAAREWCQNYLVEYVKWNVKRGVYGASCFFGPGSFSPQTAGYDWTPNRAKLHLRGLNRLLKLLEPVFAACHAAAKVAGPDGLTGRVFKFLHEVHAATAAQCAADFGILLHASDYDESIGSWQDTSHCSDGEGFATRFNHPALKGRGCGGHNKAHVTIAGRNTRMAGPDFDQQAKVFGKHHEGGVPLDYANTMMVANGDGGRYAHLTCQVAADQDGYLYLDLMNEAELPTAALVTREEYKAAVEGVGGKRNEYLELPPSHRGAAASGIAFCNGYLQNTWAGSAFYEKMGTAS